MTFETDSKRCLSGSNPNTRSFSTGRSMSTAFYYATSMCGRSPPDGMRCYQPPTAGKAPIGQDWRL